MRRRGCSRPFPRVELEVLVDLDMILPCTGTHAWIGFGFFPHFPNEVNPSQMVLRVRRQIAATCPVPVVSMSRSPALIALDFSPPSASPSGLSSSTAKKGSRHVSSGPLLLPTARCPRHILHTFVLGGLQRHLLLAACCHGDPGANRNMPPQRLIDPAWFPRMTTHTAEIEPSTPTAHVGLQWGFSFSADRDHRGALSSRTVHCLSSPDHAKVCRDTRMLACPKQVP
ncbi:hypothetical protein B0H63DRAFT_26029 [Podospora didyma]|uniref:Uncharacterized protein n=1 Tax=Podospora didyma TaxID=330526 RepID=A0AAE0P5E8_9PEZI|nr:hypothetical protein B0H63DRAFT_26029 [Podospora didyma]